MTMRSINPATGQEAEAFPTWSDSQLDSALRQVAQATPEWGACPFEERARFLGEVAGLLRERQSDLSQLMSLEMGKLITEAEAEVEKCAWVCDYYAEHGEAFLADEAIESDARRSLVAFQPLGTVLAIMPWNFPFWQVFRCVAPALAAGNTVLLKHASNVPRCALAIEQLLHDAGLPRGVFRTLLVSAEQSCKLVGSPAVQGVSLTGSDVAGQAVAATAGRHLKKTVMELGGSDAFVVLEDAELDQTAEVAVRSRFLNGGQSCIAAKRFILVEPVAQAFLERFRSGVEALKAGDPLARDTTLPPLARGDLRETLHRQVQESVAKGAVLVTGGGPREGPGYFYAATILDHVGPGMPAYAEELFGPVAAVIRARDESDALRIANDSRYGLGGSVWTSNVRRGEHFARRLACGCAFVNGLVKSDPRLPFGGIKDSGYGRELCLLGIREFVNAKTLWIG
jgi:succinate-semialdehyde dehydrogenase/glutarate-semialdehyde dehydrogenase